MKQDNINFKMFSEFKKLINTDLDDQINKNNDTLSKLEEKQEEKKDEIVNEQPNTRSNIDNLMQSFYNKISYLQFKSEKTSVALEKN